jgi:hypothetical protein
MVIAIKPTGRGLLFPMLFLFHAEVGKVIAKNVVKKVVFVSFDGA